MFMKCEYTYSSSLEVLTRFLRCVSKRGQFRRQVVVTKTGSLIQLHNWLFDEAGDRDVASVYLSNDPDTELKETVELCRLCARETTIKYKSGQVDYREALCHRLKCKRYQ